MSVRHEIEPNSGDRFFKGEVSLLLHASAQFKQNAVVTSVDMFNLFRRINTFLKDVGAYDPEQQGVSDLMTAKHFPDLEGSEFYKYLPERSLEYYQEGSFQFGSIQYYRNIA